MKYFLDAGLNWTTDKEKVFSKDKYLALCLVEFPSDNTLVWWNSKSLLRMKLNFLHNTYQMSETLQEILIKNLYRKFNIE